jgi:hypothetical protein
MCFSMLLVCECTSAKKMLMEVLEVLAINGSDHDLWHRWQTSPNNPDWSKWNSLGRPLKGWSDKLTVGKNKDGRLEVFARATNNALWHKWQTSANNSEWSY